MAQFSPEEEYIYDESPEISVGESEGWGSKIFSVFPALRSRNYKLYFSGQLVSLIGTWLQVVAQGWLVLQLTNSAFLIGLVAAIGTLPTLLFALFGGVIVDKFPKRKILVLTQASAMILAFILGILAVIKSINIWEISVLAFLLGTVNAVDSPARQAFVVEMVGKEDLSSAISLNSGLFNSARVIGPSIAGFLIAIVGVGGAFIINGVSYIAVIIALFFMRVSSIVHDTHPNPFFAIKEGVVYSVKHPIIRTLLLFAGVTSIFSWSYTTMLPYMVEHTFHMGADGLAYLYMATGIGAVSATVLVSIFTKKINSLIFILGGNTLFAIGVILFSFTTQMIYALPVLFLAGFGLLAQFSMLNTTIQSLVEDKYRGRVMSIYTIMFLGMAPIGNLQIGFLSEHLGTGFAIRIGAVISFLFGVFIFFIRKRIQQAYKEYTGA
ncbi:MAG TPA: MFS transporter [Patescibacteria group bacterium]|nr:MFS transporter [Patescibacteria group bacterium]